MPFNPTKFYLGVNIGWLNNAHHHDLSFGFRQTQNPDPPYPTPQHPNTTFEDIIDAYFMHLKIRMIKVVRMWLLETLEGMDNQKLLPPFTQSDTFSYLNWPTPGNNTPFTDRIKIIMEKARADPNAAPNSPRSRNLQIYWCLLDAAGLLSSNKPPPWYRPQFAHLVNTMRGNFKQDILLPFLNLINSYQANVFAIDIANEIDWCWAKKGGVIPIIGPIISWIRGPKIGISLPRSSMASFAKDMYSFIKAHSSFACTVSFAHYSELKKSWTTEHDFDFVDFYDYHRYLTPGAPSTDDNGELPYWSESRKCIIGEAGHHYKSKTGINEGLQASSSRALMDQSLARGYSGVLLWRYAPVGDDHRLLKRAGTGTLNSFMTNFIAARTAGSTNPFTLFERSVWNQIQAFAGTIPPGKIP